MIVPIKWTFMNYLFFKSSFLHLVELMDTEFSILEIQLETLKFAQIMCIPILLCWYN